MVTKALRPSPATAIRLDVVWRRRRVMASHDMRSDIQAIGKSLFRAVHIARHKCR
jgi:hypothetical protein